MSRGLSESEAFEMIVMGFVEPFIKELQWNMQVKLNSLISYYEMEGLSVKGIKGEASKFLKKSIW